MIVYKPSIINVLQTTGGQCGLLGYHFVFINISYCIYKSLRVFLPEVKRGSKSSANYYDEGEHACPYKESDVYTLILSLGVLFCVFLYNVCEFV